LASDTIATAGIFDSSNVNYILKPSVNGIEFNLYVYIE